MVNRSTTDINKNTKIAKSLLKKVLEKYAYTSKEKKELLDRAKKVLIKIDDNAKKKKIKAKAVLGGSAAKGTIIRDEFDCDVFVRFDDIYKNKDISDLLEKILPFKCKRVHGSRDYFQHKHQGIMFEFVPVLNIKSPKQATNVTDVSPMHVNWVKKRIKIKSDLAQEIVLTKLFFKAAGVYGAESYIKGFSGHSVDIMTAYYGGFLKTIKAIAKWNIKNKIFIDIEKHYKNLNDAIMAINASKTKSPLLIIDPIQKERNAAASLSIEKVDMIIQAAKSFIKNPNMSFFEKKHIGYKEISKLKTKGQLIIIKSKVADGKTDVIGSRILKAFTFLKKELLNNGFKIYDSGWEWDKKNDAIIWFDACDADKIELHKGPPVSMKERANNFKKKYKNCFEKDKILWVKLKRKYTDPKLFLKNHLKDKYVTDRIKAKMSNNT